MGRLALVGAIGLELAACGRIGFDDRLTPGVADQLRASISVGEATTCAIRDGDVYCWGKGVEGQLGPDGSSLSLLPVRITTIPKALKISTAVYHSCIVTVDGEVWCWGGNEHGRLGIPTTMDRSLVAVPGGPPTDPLRVELPSPAIDISVSDNTSCAVLETGQVWCWGGNSRGQLGRGTSDPSNTLENPPAVVMNLSDARRVSLDRNTSCALRASGAVACWGENARGLIDGTGSDRTVPTAVAGFANATAIAVGGSHLCAVMSRRVGCRGAGSLGELGDGQKEDSDIVVYTPLEDAVEIEAANEHTCAVLETGAIACWGWNDYYVLGTGTFARQPTPALVADLDNAVAVSAGERSTCAIRENGGVSCWGYGARGQIGDGRSAEASARQVSTIANTSLVAVGREHSCVSNTVDVACWGANRYGQLGIGTAGEPITTPQVISFVWPSSIAGLVAGSDFTCARLVDGTVYCWGYNDSGELGLGHEDPQKSPALVAVAPIADLHAGASHTCALGTDRAVRCWGSNDDGQLGDNTQTSRSTPVMVATSIDAIAVGDHHTCTLAGNAIECWGDNSASQLGDGTNVGSRPSSAPVSGGLVASAIRAGGRTTCAIEVGNGVSCWGFNTSNLQQVAGGGEYVEPLPIASTQTALFSIGGSTACAGATCWGTNEQGQLGMGDLTIEDRAEPFSVVGLGPSATTFAISVTHVCAVGDGNTYCWGENGSGEIGIGTRSIAPTAAATVRFP